jgi:cell division protein FtsI (penicillin-binding protein 3)
LKSRIILLFAGLIFLWALLIGRAGYLQLFPVERLQALQEKQFQTVITLQSRRGAIVDKNGRDLALSMTAFSLYADPKLIESKRTTAKKLSRELGISYQSIFSKIKDSKRRFVWIQRQLEPEKADRIRAMNIRGLSFVDEFRRVYPNETLLSQAMGLVGSEGQGLEGIELYYDAQLRGNKKKVSVRRDARGRPLIVDGMMFADNPDGAELKLTVDGEIQHMLEGELNRAISDYDADQAFGIILDAQTSAIVAMGSSPGFDANQGSRVPPERRRNRGVTDSFEPGSTIKAVVIAAALHAKILAPNTKYNTENGMYRIADRVIREAETSHKWPSLTVSEILAFSSNIGTTKIAFDLGAEPLRQAFEAFGFGSRLGVDLPGEAKGTLQPLPWRPHLLSNISFGHGVAVTPLQMANAYAAIANGGILNTPYIVESVRDPENGEVTEVKPKPIRRVLTPDEAAQMRLMLTGATAPTGTGVNAKVDGFLVAGKTGTAQKAKANGRGYLDKAYISSFAGFIPANDPKFVIFVVVDHPKKNAYYGSQVAAPIFSRLASYSARRAGLQPTLLSEKNLAPQRMQGPQLAERKLASTSTSNEILSLPALQAVPVVPDLMSLTLREVLQKVSGQDMDIRIRGQGTVSQVEPPVGSPIPADKRVTVFLR